MGYYPRSRALRAQSEITSAFLCCVAFGLMLFSSRSQVGASAAVLSSSQLAAELEELSGQSPFFRSQLSYATIDQRRVIYDPVMLSVVSVLYSRSPRRQHFARFRRLSLPPPEGDLRSRACPGPISVYVKASQQPSAPVYIILPGFFTQWRTGVIYNRTIATLTEHLHPDPHIIAMSGFLSAHFLQESCQHIPALLEELTADVYLRLRQLIFSEYGAQRRVALLGFSGGASAALWLVAHDGRQREGAVLFERTLAVSPPLDLLRTADHLDDLRGELSSHHFLSQGFWGSIGRVLKHFMVDAPLDWSVASRAFKRDPQSFRQRAIAQIAAKPLEDVGRFLDLGRQQREELSYEELFVHRGLTAEDSLRFGALSRPERRQRYSELTDIRKALQHIRSPAVLYDAQDDPFIGTLPLELLQDIKHHPYIHHLRPSFGAHLGLFVDPIFAALLQVTLGPA